MEPNIVWSGTAALAPMELNSLTFLINKHLSSIDGLKMFGISSVYVLPLSVVLEHDMIEDIVSGRITDSNNVPVAGLKFKAKARLISFHPIT